MNFVYGLPDPRLRSLMIGPLHKMIQMHHLVTDQRKGLVHIVSGTASHNGQPMKVAFMGSWAKGQHNTLPFYQHLLFQEDTAVTEDCGECSMMSLRREAEALAGQVDLIAIDMNQILAWRPRSGDWVIGPIGIRMAIDFHPGENWQDIVHRIGSQTGNMRLLRKSNFSYRISHDADDFTDFYHALHIPMVKNRYHDFGDILSEDGLRHVFKNGGFLLQILDKDGQVIAAGLEYLRNHVLYGLLNGVRDGSPNLMKQGALLAIYYFSMQWCLENRIRRFDAGLCPPFTTSGLYQHKRSWRFEPELNFWKPHSVLLWAPESAPCAVEWMKANPIVKQFARWGGDGVKAVYEAIA